jgi:hypothetical protein
MPHGPHHRNALVAIVFTTITPQRERGRNYNDARRERIWRKGGYFSRQPRITLGREDQWLRVPRHGGWGDAEGRLLRTNEAPEGDLEEEIEALVIPAVAELHNTHIAKSNSIEKK